MMRNEDISSKSGHFKLVLLAFMSSSLNLWLRGDVRASALWETLWYQSRFQPRVSKIRQLIAEVRSRQVKGYVWLYQRQWNTHKPSQIRDSCVRLSTAVTLTQTAAAAVRGRGRSSQATSEVTGWTLIRVTRADTLLTPVAFCKTSIRLKTTGLNTSSRTSFGC